MPNLSNILWLFFIFSALSPWLRQVMLHSARMKLMRRLEESRGTRFISLIHRQEAVSLLGIPISRYINVEDSEQILRAIRLTPPDMPIDILLHTPGGLVLAARQIALALKNHGAKVTVFVPHYAMSGGTLIALAADEIVMDPNAVLGPVDPQIEGMPAVSIIKATSQKSVDDLDDKTLILADVSRKAIDQVRKTVYEILLDKVEPGKAELLAAKFTEGEWTHDHPITCTELAEMGLPVCGRLPREIYDLMDYYPQPVQQNRPVQYIPVPYRQPSRKA